MTQRFLYYNLTNGTTGDPSADSHYIDLAAGLSAMNRRLYRQGRQYHIANITVIDTSGDSKVRFATLPQVWTTNKAHKLMFDAWKDQRSRALENAPSNVTGRWADFKVYMSQQHRKEDLILPTNSDLVEIDAGEWEYSEISYMDQTGTELDNQPVWMLGDHVPTGTGVSDGVGVCKALQEMLSIPPESPIVPDLAKSVIMSMNPATGDDNVEVLANIRDDNDLAPYNGTIVIGANSVASGDTDSFVTREVGWSSKGTASLPVMGFPVPLGLLEVRQEDAENNKIGVLIEFVPGSYKGVHAEAF